MALESGHRLGPYEIVAPLGAGGMGEVYRARNPRLERGVAIKVLPEHFLEDGDSLTRFQAEAKAIASLSHPNIVAIHDTGQEGKRHRAPRHQAREPLPPQRRARAHLEADVWMATLAP